MWDGRLTSHEKESRISFDDNYFRIPVITQLLVLLLLPNHSIHSDKVKAYVEIKLYKKQDIRYPQIKRKAS